MAGKLYPDPEHDLECGTLQEWRTSSYLSTKSNVSEVRQGDQDRLVVRYTVMCPMMTIIVMHDGDLIVATGGIVSNIPDSISSMCITPIGGSYVRSYCEFIQSEQFHVPNMETKGRLKQMDTYVKRCGVRDSLGTHNENGGNEFGSPGN